MLNKFRILLLTSQGQDYLCDDLLYGFRKLFRGNAVDLPRKDIMYMDFDGQVHPRPEYAMNARYFAEDPVDRDIEIDEKDFDLVINLSCRRNGGHAPIYIDGEDDTIIHAPTTGELVFKREFYEKCVPNGQKVLPVTFGLPDHICPIMSETGMFDSKSVEIHSSFQVEHGPNRRALAAKYPVTIYPTRKEYIYAINESRYVLSPKGAGWDCQRHYEILGRAVPIIEVTKDAPLHFQKMWVDGENCLTYDGDPAIIKEKVKSIGSVQWDLMVQRGFEELMDSYLASRVAEDLLKRSGVTL